MLVPGIFVVTGADPEGSVIIDVIKVEGKYKFVRILSPASYATVVVY
jgi:hypothetical protein